MFPSRMCSSILKVIAVLGVAGILSACKQEAPRHYTEIAFKSKGSPMAAVDIPIRITWTVPAGWIEEPGGDPLRVASFLAPDPSYADSADVDPKALDVSIVQLSGEAGGVEANVIRWMRQAKIPPSQDVAQEVIAHAESLSVASGQRGILVDFTGQLAGDMTQTNSIIGAIVPGNGYTVFVKAMGDRDRLLALRPQILLFCRSVSIVEEKK